MNAPLIGTIEIPRLSALRTDVGRRGRTLLDAGRDAYLASLGAVVTAQQETAKAVEALVERTQATYDTLVTRGAEVDAKRATKVAELRGELAERRAAAAERVDATVLRPARALSAGVVRAAGVPTRDEVRGLAASVAELSAKVDLLVAQLGAIPAVAVEPTVVVSATDDGWAVQVEGTANVLATHPTKDEAVEAARALAAERAPSHLIVYKKDGTVQDRISYNA